MGAIAGSPDNAIASFDDFLYEKMAETKLPSLTVAALKGGRVVHSRAFGLKNIESATPSTPRTNYGVGSVTKSVTALGIGKLVEGGRLDFHDPVVKFLPELDRYRAFEGVEIHHLLTHSSGISGLGSAEVLIFNAVGLTKKWFPVSTFSDIVSFFDQVDEWGTFQPGTRYFYLNEGFYLLGEVISRVSGMPYFGFVRKEIFEPLGMSRTFFSKEEVEADGDWATPYLIKEGKATPSVVPWGSGPAGGLMSNVMDLSNYLQMYLDRGEFGGKRLVGREIIERMETPFSKPPFSYFKDQGYGYALHAVNDFFGHRLVSHDGSVGVYTSSIAYVPDINTGICLLSNAEGYRSSILAIYGLLSLMGEDPKKFEPVRLEILVKRLEGDYSSYKDTVSAKVKRNGDFLILSGEDIGDNIVLVHERSTEGEAVFFTYSGGARLEVYFSYDDRGVQMTFERYRYRKTSALPSGVGK